LTERPFWRFPAKWLYCVHAASRAVFTIRGQESFSHLVRHAGQRTRHAATGGSIDMIKRYNNKSLALGIPGIVLQITGQGVSRVYPETGIGLLGVLALFVGTGLLIVGLAYYAIAKGRSGWWGLCGFLSLIGLLILALLKDKAPEG
jgi:hypothetical protein